MDGFDARAGANEALGEMARLTGAPDLTLDEDGVCRLVFEGGRGAYIVLDAGAGDLVLWSTVGTLPPDRPDEALRALLRANLFWQGTEGGTIGLTPDGGTVVLARRVPLPGLPGSALIEEIGALVGSAAQLAATLGDSAPERPVSGTPDAFDPRLAASMIRG